MKIITFIIFLCLSACTNFIHTVEIQQGNILTQEKIDQLEIGLSKRQVRILLGTSPIIDNFHKDRWDYIYTFQDNPFKKIEKKYITLYFQNEILSAWDGNIEPSGTPQKIIKHEQIIIVPKQDRHNTIFGKLFK